MPVSQTSPGRPVKTPEYKRIAATLRDEIANGLAPGDVLPSEHSLATRFGVNRHTVRRGVDELVQDGLLSRQRGRGTVVLRTPIDFPITLGSGFSELIRRSGREASNQILSKKVVVAPADAADALGVPESAEVVFLEQVRLVDLTPLAISRHWLPMPRFRPVLDGFRGGSLHSFFERELKISVRLHRATVRAQFPSPDDALNLRVTPRTATLASKIIDVDADSGEPVEFAETIFRGDATQMTLTPGPAASLEAQPSSEV